MIEKLQEILTDITGDDTIVITEETNILSDIEINSYELIDIVCRVEDEFGVEITDKQAKSFQTVGDIIAFLESNKDE